MVSPLQSYWKEYWKHAGKVPREGLAHKFSEGWMLAAGLPKVAFILKVKPRPLLRLSSCS